MLTSPQNDAATRAIFRDAGNFGLAPGSVRFVVQGTLPAVDRRQRGDPAGGARTGWRCPPTATAGCCRRSAPPERWTRWRTRGCETIFTFQVDNPLVRVCRPELLGHHRLAGADMTSVVVRKVGPEEKMGVIARVDGNTAVVEYSDLAEELAEERDDDGELVYWAGSIAVHCIEVAFATALTEGGLRLPFHRAVKRVPYLDAGGQPVSPAEPNAIKFETFLFDALPAASRTITVEAAREDEFSPIKNAEGADSPETARRDLNGSTPAGSRRPASRCRATPRAGPWTSRSTRAGRSTRTSWRPRSRPASRSTAPPSSTDGARRDGPRGP